MSYRTQFEIRNEKNRIKMGLIDEKELIEKIQKEIDTSGWSMYVVCKMFGLTYGQIHYRARYNADWRHFVDKNKKSATRTRIYVSKPTY